MLDETQCVNGSLATFVHETQKAIESLTKSFCHWATGKYIELITVAPPCLHIGWTTKTKTNFLLWVLEARDR